MGYADGNKPKYIPLTGDYEEKGFEALVKSYPSGKAQRLMRFDSGEGVSLSDNGQEEKWPAKWHYHDNIEETYVVMRGYIAMAVFSNHMYPWLIRVQVYRKGESVTIERGEIHNTLESLDVRLSVTKVSYSDDSAKDWHEVKVDDSKLRAISVESLFKEGFVLVEVAN